MIIIVQSSKGYPPSLDSKIIKVMNSLCDSGRPLFQHFKNKLKAYRKTINRLLQQAARIIVPNFNVTGSDLTLNTNNRVKRGIFHIISGLAGLAYYGASAYLNWKKKKAIKKGYKAM